MSWKSVDKIVDLFTFAMNRNCTACRFTNLQEILQNRIARLAAIGEEELLVVEASVQETSRIVQFQIQSNDCTHIVLSEVIEIGFGCMARIAVVDLRTIVWAAEGNKFIRYNPIQIAVFNSFVILVFNCIKIVEIEKSCITCLIHRLQAVHQADCVVRRAVRCITELCIRRPEIQWLERLLRRFIQINYLQVNVELVLKKT